MQKLVEVFIDSKTYPGGAILPKIWILLLSFFKEVEICHEHKEIFINLADKEHLIRQEYLFRLEVFFKSWWVIWIWGIGIKDIQHKLSEWYHAIIPIEKIPGKSHLIVLLACEKNGFLAYDNKQGEYKYSFQEFECYFQLKNGKYILRCR
jgi:hypothetical protein